MLPKANLHKEVPAHADNYDHIVIDGPPRVNELARSAILAADQILIPVQPSPYDVWGANEIVALIREAKTFKEGIRSSFVINRKIVNTAIGRDVNEALATHELPVFEANICQRVAFAETAATGSTVIELDPNSLASKEITALANEILRQEMKETAS